MSLLIDGLIVARELLLLTYVVVTSPFAMIAGGLLLLGNSNI